jgi:hypothetical protein
LARGERHFVRFELGEPPTDACAENERAVGIEEIGLDEGEAAARVAQGMQSAQHVVEPQDEMVQDAIAEHEIEPAETSQVVSQKVQFFEGEVWKRIGPSRVIQKFVADIDGDHFEPRLDSDMRRRGAGTAADFENPPRPNFLGLLGEPVIAAGRS